MLKRLNDELQNASRRMQDTGCKIEERIPNFRIKAFQSFLSFSTECPGKTLLFSSEAPRLGKAFRSRPIPSACRACCERETGGHAPCCYRLSLALSPCRVGRDP